MSDDLLRYEGEDERPKKKPRSTAAKIVIVILCLAGGTFLLICGGCIYSFVSFRRGTDPTPQAAVETTKEIADIRIPPRFQPQGSFGGDALFMKMRGAVYRVKDAQGQMFLLQIHVRLGSIEGQLDQVDEQLTDRMQSEKQELKIKGNPVIKTFNIRGRDCRFQFAIGENDSGRQFRQVTGSFPGRNAAKQAVMLILQVEEQAWDEAEVVQMIESIE